MDEEAPFEGCPQRQASVEFLTFLADISNPATGEISISRLANWLQLTEVELHQRWKNRGNHIPWSLFADELLAVLDAVQDVTYELPKTVEWFMHTPIEVFDRRTADQVVAAGDARRLVYWINQNKVQVW
jgi:hypothetical protein